MGMGSPNKRRCYTVTLSLIGMIGLGMIELGHHLDEL